MTMLKKLQTWQLLLLFVICSAATLFVAGQAVTMAWLSAFRDRADQIFGLQVRFWLYALLGIAILVIDAKIAILLTRRMKSKPPQTP